MLERSRIRPASEVLASAFHEDPLYRTVLPDEGRRPGRLAWLMARMLRYGLLYGHVYTTAEVEGVACWLPPGHARLTPADIVRSGLYAIPLRLGLGAYRRLTAFTGYSEPMRHRCVPEPHWYLMLLGVHPSRRRRGLGGRLMQLVLDRAGEEGIACYLETEKEENVRFYGRFGFRPAEAGREPRYGVRTWALLRPDTQSI